MELVKTNMGAWLAIKTNHDSRTHGRHGSFWCSMYGSGRGVGLSTLISVLLTHESDSRTQVLYLLDMPVVRYCFMRYCNGISVRKFDGKRAVHTA